MNKKDRLIKEIKEKIFSENLIKTASTNSNSKPLKKKASFDSQSEKGELMKEASELLSKARDTISNLCSALEKQGQKINSLEQEKTALEHEKTERLRKDDVSVVINEMIDKKLITKKNASAKEKELFEMEKEAFESFAEVVEKINKTDVKIYGPDCLQFFVANDNINKREPHSMQEEISNMR